jgi:hypothetical protein
MNDNKTENVLSSGNKESWISRYSIFVGRIDGVPVYINFSFAFVFILITWTLSSTILPNIYPGLVQSTYIIIGIVCAFISFFSILLHEVGHSIVASNYGIKFQKIVLFALGGIALNPNEITVPKKEITYGICWSFNKFHYFRYFVATLVHIFSKSYVHYTKFSY